MWRPALAIVTVAKGLGNKAKPQWEDALEQLRQSQLEEPVHKSVELSIKSLGSEKHR